MPAKKKTGPAAPTVRPASYYAPQNPGLESVLARPRPRAGVGWLTDEGEIRARFAEWLLAASPGAPGFDPAEWIRRVRSFRAYLQSPGAAGWESACALYLRGVE